MRASPTSARGARGPRSHRLRRRGPAGALAERLGDETGFGERFADRFEPRDVGRIELDDVRDEQRFARRAAPRALGNRFVRDAFVRRVLIDQDERVAVERENIGIVELREDARTRRRLRFPALE
jgi:hypothetical protein